MFSWGKKRNNKSVIVSNEKLIMSGCLITSGHQNIAIGNLSVTNPGYIIGHDYGYQEDWLQIEYQHQKTQIRLSGKWVALDVPSLLNKHPLDFGNALDTNDKEDINEIVVQYQKHIKNSPWLQKLRHDYDMLLEKHELFDTIKGEDNAV